MTPKRLYFVMIGVIVLLSLIAGGGTYMANSMLTKKSQRLSELKLENKVLEGQKEDVIRAQKDLEKYADLEKIAKQVVPQEKDQARTVREIVRLAGQAGTNLSAITFSNSSLGQKAAPVAKPAEGESSAGSSTPTAPPITQTQAVPGIPGLYVLDITVQNSEPTSYRRLIDFLERLENNRRTAQVAELSITPNATNRANLTFNMKINVYIKP